MRAALLLCSSLLFACGSGPAPSAEPLDEASLTGPLLGGSGGDQADRACHVVLRELRRPANQTGGYEASCEPGGSCWYVWAGVVELSSQAVAEGVVPEVLYRTSWDNDASWHKATATALAGAPGRYQVRLERHTAPSGASYTSLSRTRLEVAPYGLTRSGARLFDHNRNPGDFDNYLLEASNGWSVKDDPSVCAPPPANLATVEFLPGWRTAQHGAPVARGTLRLEYDLSRLTACRGTHNGYPTWDVRAFVRFSPGGQVLDGTVREYDRRNGTPLPSGHAMPLELPIPAGSQSAEVWFRNANGAGDSCEAYDSNLGANYRLEVLAKAPAPVGWAGDFGGSFSRACTHAAGLAEPIWMDSYIRERACSFVDADVWVPGVTDTWPPHPEHIGAQVEVSVDGKPNQYVWLSYVGQVGNNARFRWELPRADMTQQFWNTYRFAFRFSTDGRNWHRIGQTAGPQGGAARTVERDPSWCSPGWTCAR